MIIVITTITILIRADVQAVSFTDGKHDKKESRRQEGTTSSTGLLNSSIGDNYYGDTFYFGVEDGVGVSGNSDM